jgi:hypothetical protein
MRASGGAPEPLPVHPPAQGEFLSEGAGFWMEWLNCQIRRACSTVLSRKPAGKSISTGFGGWCGSEAG